MFRQIIIGTVAFIGWASAAQATVEISTTGRGLTSNVRVVGQPLTLVGPIGTITGRTSPGYNLTGGAASLATSVGLGNNDGITATLGLNSGTIATTASADGTTPADTTSGNASAALDNLDIHLFTSSGGPITSVLRLTATQVQSLSSVSKAGTVITQTGQSIFSDLDLGINGSSVFSLGSNASVAANFIAYNQNGLRVTLNQQSASMFDNTRVLITNAIGINFSNYLLDGRTLNGTITIGQSISEMISTDPVPEPASWAQLLAGFALAGAAQRHRRIIKGA